MANFTATENLQIDKAGNGFTLVATGPVGANVTTGSFNITLPTLTVTSQPTATQAGSNLAVQFTLLDGVTPVSNTAVNLTIGTNPSGGLLTGVTSVLTDANGVANFTSAQITIAGVGYTLVGATGAVTAITNTFNVTLPKGFIFAAGSQGNFIVTTPYNTTTGVNGTKSSPTSRPMSRPGCFPRDCWLPATRSS